MRFLNWGRIKIVQSEYEAGRSMSIEQVTDYGPTAHLRNEPYGWCWAATALLDGHPQFAERFRRLPRRVDDSTQEFSRLFRTQFRVDQRQLDEQWQLFVVNLDYGYDIPREAIIYEPTRSDNGETTAVDIRADRGWQSTGLVVSAGTTYSTASGGPISGGSRTEDLVVRTGRSHPAISWRLSLGHAAGGGQRSDTTVARHHSLGSP